MREDESSTRRPSRGISAGEQQDARESTSQRCLNEKWLSSFLRTATPYTARYRQIIYYQGRPTAGVYLVESGRIKCTSTATDGRELLLREFGAGEFFGVIEALNGAPALATAVATETSSLKWVRNELFRSLVADDSELTRALVRILAQQLKSAYEHATDLAYEPIERRVLRTLSKLGRKSDATIVVERALSVNELAGMVAASRTRVSLVVQDLIRRGRLSRVEGKFVLAPRHSPI